MKIPITGPNRVPANQHSAAVLRPTIESDTGSEQHVCIQTSDERGLPTHLNVSQAAVGLVTFVSKALAPSLKLLLQSDASCFSTSGGSIV